MARKREEGLTTRETQIMQVIWRFQEATVEVIQEHLPDPLVDSTIRTMLQIMADKGYVAFRKEGRAKVYRPLLQQSDVRKSAVRQVIDRLFNGSPDMLLAYLVDDNEVDLEKLKEELGERKKPS
jgi:BlaI family penicillinase repressor